MVDGDVFRMSEAADTAESAAAGVARKQTTEELAKSASKLTLPSKMLPMLRMLNKKCWLLLRRSLPSQPDKGRAADAKSAATLTLPSQMLPMLRLLDRKSVV